MAINIEDDLNLKSVSVCPGCGHIFQYDPDNPVAVCVGCDYLVDGGFPNVYEVLKCDQGNTWHDVNVHLFLSTILYLIGIEVRGNSYDILCRQIYTQETEEV